MEVAFYILFLLFASPLKKEDACKMAKKDQPLLTPDPAESEPNEGGDDDMELDPPAPVITIDESVKKVYDIGDEITLKWSIANTRVEYFMVFIFKEGQVMPEHSGKVQGVSILDQYSYKLPKLQPGKHDFAIAAYSSGNVQIVQAKGSFTIKNQLLKITRPRKDHHEYEHDERIAFAWSASHPNQDVRVVKFDIKVFKDITLKHEDTVECVVQWIDCSNYQLAKLLEPGRYRVDVRVYFSDDGNTEDSEAFVVKYPPVRILEPRVNNYRYEHDENVELKWTTAQMKENVRVEKVSILVLNVLPSYVVHSVQVSCDDNSADCFRCELPELETGEYDFKIKVYFPNNVEYEVSRKFRIGSEIPGPLSPVDDHEYECGEKVILTWEVARNPTKAAKFEFKVWSVTDRNPSEYSNPCRGDQQANICRMGHVKQGKYKWMVEMIPKGRKRMKSEFGSFAVVKVPAPEIQPLSKTYDNKHKITISWKIDDPRPISRTYKIFVLGKDADVRKDAQSYPPETLVPFDVKSAEIEQCTTFDLQQQNPGRYECFVKMTTQAGTITISVP